MVSSCTLTPEGTSARLQLAIQRSRPRLHGLRTALQVQSFARSFSDQPRRPGNPGAAGTTYERVLRYPDGVRVLRYPLPPSATDTFQADSIDEQLAEEWQTLNAFKSSAAGMGVHGRSGRRPSAAAAAPTEQAATAGPSPAPAPAAKPQQQDTTRLRVPASPLELLRLMTSAENKQAQQEVWARVRGSYEVLEGCPFVSPRPLYVLAAEQANEDEAGLTYTLRTRVARQDTEDELSRVLGRRRPDGSGLIHCSEMRDGVVTFEDDADAERFGQLLEADGAREVTVARCDSHELFRNVQAVRGVVVLLRRGCYLPQPHQLATSLKAQETLEDQQ